MQKKTRACLRSQEGGEKRERKKERIGMKKGSREWQERKEEARQQRRRLEESREDGRFEPGWRETRSSYSETGRRLSIRPAQGYDLLEQS